MEKILVLALLLSILGVSIACLVKKDKKCHNSTQSNNVKVGMGDSSDILPPYVINLMLNGTWSPTGRGIVCKQLGSNLFQISNGSDFVLFIRVKNAGNAPMTWVGESLTGYNPNVSLQYIPSQNLLTISGVNAGDVNTISVIGN